MIGNKEAVRNAIMNAGGVKVRFASADSLQNIADSGLSDWISHGYNAGMDWMIRHAELRKKIDNVFPQAKSVIVTAFPYNLNGKDYPLDMPYIAHYALFFDYHYALREAIENAISPYFNKEEYRICIDSAPISERFWALQSSLGIKGDNGAVIIPGIGAEVFLAEIITDVEFEPDEPSSGECLHCGKCHNSCPTGALLKDGTIDCNRCLSYLTIEHRGEWTSRQALKAMSSEAGHHTLFGCDACIVCCPLNNKLSKDFAEKSPLKIHPAITEFANGRTPASKNEFNHMFKGSPIRRCGWDGWLRNVRNISSDM